MEITFAYVDGDDKSINYLDINTAENETIKIGQLIPIELTDETVIEREVIAIRIWQENSDKKGGKMVSVDSVSGDESCEVEVHDIKGHVQTTSMPSPAEMRRLNAMKNVMPFKEIKGGTESIYDHIDKNYKVPKKVIAYLQTTQPHMVSMGIYKHPFKDKELVGPYFYTDGEYYWDRDAWKYVMKYHVTLPKDFIDKVMSEEGTAFLDKCAKSNNSWSKTIKEWKDQPNSLCLMPDNAGDLSLEDF